MTLSPKALVEIVSSNEIEVDAPVAVGEMAVFNAVKQWINHDENSRKQHLEEVLFCTCLQLSVKSAFSSLQKSHSCVCKGFLEIIDFMPLQRN